MAEKMPRGSRPFCPRSMPGAHIKDTDVVRQRWAIAEVCWRAGRVCGQGCDKQVASSPGRVAPVARGGGGAGAGAGGGGWGKGGVGGFSAKFAAFCERRCPCFLEFCGCCFCCCLPGYGCGPAPWSRIGMFHLRQVFGSGHPVTWILPRVRPPPGARGGMLKSD